MSERKLATIRRIAEVKPIEGADRIVSYRVDGWWVTDAVGKYAVGDLVVYLEPDSWVPHTLAPFLTKNGAEPRVFEGVEGQRLRTMKMKGVLSQGLLLPVDQQDGQPFITADAHLDGIGTMWFVTEGDDVTEALGILKWEAPIPAQLAGQVRGNFPSNIPKTCQDRIQNVRDLYKLRDHSWSVTEKLHGSSCTFYLDNEGVFHVCSRNLDLKETEGNSYWLAARKFDIEGIMQRNSMQGMAIQGELIGEGINGNQYKVTLGFYVFDMFNTNTQKYILPIQLEAACERLGLKHVPILDRNCFIGSASTQDLLEAAEGKSALNGSEREGFVMKSNSVHDLSMKCVSNRWLMKYE